MSDSPEIPLAPPAGMRDLLPPDAATRRALVDVLLERFRLHGYELVTTPVFEHAGVIERGLWSIDRRELFRFVEPESGEVALLRPDITPQIARIVATQLADRPAPWRLCYAGSVIRQRRDRARRPRRVFQAGVELIGRGDIQADLEGIRLADDALEAVGLAGHVVELHLPSLGWGALAAVEAGARPTAAEALARKDAASLEEVLRGTTVERQARDRLLAMTGLYGDPGVLEAARPLFDAPAEREALDRLDHMIAALRGRPLRGSLQVDLGEVRDMAYYSGISFAILADGPGEPVGGGGRYDDLLTRFDAPAPATGFGLDVGNLEWALRAQGTPPNGVEPGRVVVFGGSAPDREALARDARTTGLTAAVLDAAGPAEALAYAEAWGYDAAVELGPRALTARRREDGAERRLPRAEQPWAALRRWIDGGSEEADG
ncbi:MAG: ATP phosphoribosyltransferase regulatory subunit [Sandaracinaceae bacterium]